MMTVSTIFIIDEYVVIIVLFGPVELKIILNM